MVELIPRKVLFGNPERVQPSLSPDGSHLAWLAPHQGLLNVWACPLGSESGPVDLSAARPVTEETGRSVQRFIWSPDSRRLLYLRDAGGDENWRVFDVDREGGDRRDLTPFEGVQAQLIARHPSVQDQILIGLNRDNPQLHDVYSLELASGELQKVAENPGFVGWLTTTQLEAKGALAPRPDGGTTLMVRSSVDAPWRELISWGQEDVLSTEPISFCADGRRILALSSVGTDNSRLVWLDAATAQVEELASRPGADVSAVSLHPVTQEPQIVVYMRERCEYEVLDKAFEADLDALRALHPGDLFFAGGDDSGSIWLVGFKNDTGPVPYFLYDRQSSSARFVFEHQPQLSAYELSNMEPFSLKARDGLVLHGYATFPKGERRQHLPTVLLVHGGPWWRDSWGYDAHAQWLANRGYLCLQVNFRGSTGYGKAFINAGDRQWGAKMHDDLIDTVAYAISEGWADPAKVAIFGGSYGGYAALCGAAFTPEVFCCAVDIVGPSNLLTFIESVPPYWAPMIAELHNRLGHPEKDRDLLWSRSPLSRAEDINIPLLIAQGANDPRVRQAESEQIVAALERAGIDHEYMLFPDEGHGFGDPENRLRFYAAAERFLAQNLGGRAEP